MGVNDIWHEKLNQVFEKDKQVILGLNILIEKDLINSLLDISYNDFYYKNLINYC